MHAPSISVAMVVRDEAREIESALSSVAPWADELVVVDTGSLDDTVERARTLGARVISMPWGSDFSKARNEAAAHCRGSWVLSLDADEVWVGHAPTRAVLDGVSVLQVAHRELNLEGRIVSAHARPRLYRRDAGLAYAGRIEERLCGEGLRLSSPLAGCVTEHLGWDPRVRNPRNRGRAYLSMLLDEIDVADQRGALYLRLGAELMAMGRGEEACGYFWVAAERFRNSGHGSFGHIRSWCALVDGLQQMGHPISTNEMQMAIAAAQRVLPSCPELEISVLRGLLNLATFDPAGPYRAEALAAVDRIVDALESGQGQRTAMPRWALYEDLGQLLADSGWRREAYTALRLAFNEKPESASGWPALLNAACGLSIDLGCDGDLFDLFGRLLSREDTGLDMLWLYLDQIRAADGPDAADLYLRRLGERFPRAVREGRTEQIA